MITAKPVPQLSEKDILRFWSKVDKTTEDGCWEWTDCPDKDGYGRMWISGVRVRANRVSYLLGKENPNNLLVCHRCDNPKCCNPNHLFLGSAKDNAIDRAKKGRSGRPKEGPFSRTERSKSKPLPKPSGGQVKYFYKKGDTVGDLIYINEADDYVLDSINRRYKRGLFRCRCGKEFITSVSAARTRHTISCGCYRPKSIKHGCSNDSITDVKGYNVWMSIKQRCYNPKNPSYKYYGALGITVCSSWLNSFSNFKNDMGERPSLEHSLDRIENDKGYYKGNCRWATKLEQANNKTNNRLIAYRDVSKTMAEWCRFLGIDGDLFKQQLNRDSRGIEYCVAFGIVNKFKKSRKSLNV